MKNKTGHFETRSSNNDYQEWSFPEATQCGYGTIEVKRTDWDLRTCCIHFWPGTSRVAEEVHKLRSNSDAMLGERLGIEPHETSCTHVL